MKKVSLFVLSLVTLLIASCSPMIYSDYVVEAYGTPYYGTGGVFLYYQYQGMYYYPHYRNGVCTFRAYKRPIPNYRPPVSHQRPPVGHLQPNRRPTAPRPSVRPQTPNRRPANNVRRPSQPTRSGNITRFGGRR